MQQETKMGKDRWYPRYPRAGVGAVIVREGSLLMVKRGKEPDRGKWSIPGGGVELGESIEAAAKREVFEECSIKIEIERVLDAADNIIRDEKGRIKFHFVIIDMVGKYLSGETQARSDAEDCRWVPVREINGLDIPSSLRAMLKKHGII